MTRPADPVAVPRDLLTWLLRAAEGEYVDTDGLRDRTEEAESRDRITQTHEILGTKSVVVPPARRYKAPTRRHG